jgi:hypothetical protein
MVRSKQVASLILKDTWSIAEGTVDNAPYLVRFRTPVLKADQTIGYGQLLTILWTYAPENSGEMPDSVDSERMAKFEDRFTATFEHDAQAVLTAVFTFDGARQWIVYTDDVSECGKRICEMPQEVEPYPIELTTEEDPSWSYLRDRILSQIDFSSIS